MRSNLSAIGASVLVAAAIAVSLVAGASVNAAPTDPSRIAAVFPPWWDQARTVTAGASVGEILTVGGAPFVVILRGDPRRLARRARLAGALLILNSDAAGFCSALALEPRS